MIRYLRYLQYLRLKKQIKKTCVTPCIYRLFCRRLKNRVVYKKPCHGIQKAVQWYTKNRGIVYKEPCPFRHGLFRFCCEFVAAYRTLFIQLSCSPLSFYSVSVLQNLLCARLLSRRQASFLYRPLFVLPLFDWH